MFKWMKLKKKQPNINAITTTAAFTAVEKLIITQKLIKIKIKLLLIMNTIMINISLLKNVIS